MPIAIAFTIAVSAAIIGFAGIPVAVARPNLLLILLAPYFAAAAIMGHDYLHRAVGGVLRLVTHLDVQRIDAARPLAGTFRAQERLVWAANHPVGRSISIAKALRFVAGDVGNPPTHRSTGVGSPHHNPNGAQLVIGWPQDIGRRH